MADVQIRSRKSPLSRFFIGCFTMIYTLSGICFEWIGCLSGDGNGQRSCRTYLPCIVVMIWIMATMIKDSNALCL